MSLASVFSTGTFSSPLLFAKECVPDSTDQSLVFFPRFLAGDSAEVPLCTSPGGACGGVPEGTSSASGPPSVLGGASSVLLGGTSPDLGGALIGSVRGDWPASASGVAPSALGSVPGRPPGGSSPGETSGSDPSVAATPGVKSSVAGTPGVVPSLPGGGSVDGGRSGSESSVAATPGAVPSVAAASKAVPFVCAAVGVRRASSNLASSARALSSSLTLRKKAASS